MAERKVEKPRLCNVCNCVFVATAEWIKDHAFICECAKATKES